MLSLFEGLPCPQCVKKHFGKICGATAIAVVTVYIYFQYQLSNKIKISKDDIDRLFNIKSRKNTFPSELSELFVREFSTNKYYIEYNGFLSNHLSHGMIALYRINATNNNDIIKSFMKHYSNKLEDISLSTIDTNREACNWYKIDAYLGQRKNFYGIFEMMKTDAEVVYNQDIQHLVKTRFPLC